MTITGRFVALLASSVAVMALAVQSWAGFWLINGVLVCIALLDAALAGSPRALTMTRSGVNAVRLGESADVLLAVHNTGRRPLRGVLRDAWPPSAGVVATRHRVRLPVDAHVSITTTLSPTRRGVRRPDRVTVRSYGPLGLAGRQTTHRVAWEVRTLPRFSSRKHLPSRLARLRELDGSTAIHIRGQGTEFDSLREFVSGDDARSIDWRATARASNVMVRTWRPERDRQVLIVLDTGRSSAARIGTGTRLDDAMDAAMLLAVLASRAGDRVDVLAYDRQVRADVRGRAATEVLGAVSDALGDVEPELAETDARGMVSQILRRAPHHALVVLLTSIEPAIIESGLLPVMPMLTSRHTVVVASVADPRLAEMALARGGIAEVYDAASAATATAARNRVTATLTRTGVTVIDAAPDLIAPRLADTYMALKSSGRL